MTSIETNIIALLFFIPFKCKTIVLRVKLDVTLFMQFVIKKKKVHISLSGALWRILM